LSAEGALQLRDSEDEETESLVTKLAQFYADRTLTKATGQIITVDDGLHEAFLR
jgi:hypothetical protein